ncbi:UPF0182 family protein [Buchananella felis]|uniref:UPF0182 family membrane protein n=1 Tax=Buchananella felis TaxID=3231492 RepID=UPI0035275842
MVFSFYSSMFEDKEGQDGAPKRPTPPRTPAKPGPAFRKPGPLSITLLILAVLGGLIRLASLYWTEVLWFQQLGYTRVLLTKWLTTFGVAAVGTLIIAAIVFAALFVAWRTRPQRTELAKSYVALAPYARAFERFRKIAFVVIPVAVGLFLSGQLAQNWTVIVAAFNQVPFGVSDPQFGLDVSFFVFTLPLLRLLASVALAAFIAALLANFAIHYLYGATHLRKGWGTTAMWVQTSAIAALISLLIGAQYWLSRYALLVGENAKFDGASYTDINAVLPARGILAGIAVVVALLFVASVFVRSWKLPIVGIAVMVASGLVIGVAYPALIQRFSVDPNAQEAESPYIQRNIDATLAAHGLQGVETTTYRAVTEASSGQLRHDSESTASVRLLDPNIISPTFRQLQQNRQYYGFSRALNVDRYVVDGQRRDTVIAVRELNQDGLGAEQRTWVNDHTVYTHGFGVVAAYGNATGADGRPAFWEQGIPSQGDMGEYEPRVYFGKNSPHYSIVGGPEGSEPQELDYPDDAASTGQVNTTFKGNGGPSVGNVFNQLLYAIRFGSMEILFSDQVNSHSQILYDRDPHVRVAKVAPWLTLDEEAYPAVVDRDGNPATPKELVWIVDAYTTTDAYPYAARVTMPGTPAGFTGTPTVNYVRNSVKAVVNAYDGSVTLYQWDEDDAIVNTWGNVFPGVLTPKSEISADLMAHLRYPEDLFQVQRELLGRYHVTDARSFYSGGDFWKQPADPSNPDSGVPQDPYYLTMQMPGQEGAEFSLTSVFIPGGNDTRNVLTGFVAVDSETGNQAGKVREGYGKLRVLELPRDLTVPGPGQVKNIFDSTARVSTELNLLAQNSSQVVRGNLLTLPVGGGLLYVQPIYVQSAQGTQYPLLRSVLVAFGEKVGFAPTLGEALDQVFGGDSGAKTGADEVPSEALEPTEPLEPGQPGQEPSAQASGAPFETGSSSAPAAPAEPGSTIAPPDPANPAVPGGTGGTVTGDPKAALADALARANAAMQAADSAMRAGDWAAYGKAQEDLDRAIKDAIAAEAALR